MRDTYIYKTYIFWCTYTGNMIHGAVLEPITLLIPEFHLSHTSFARPENLLLPSVYYLLLNHLHKQTHFLIPPLLLLSFLKTFVHGI